MLKRYACKLGSAWYFGREAKRKNERDIDLSSVNFSSVHKDLYVRIILASGFVEVHRCAVMASQVMDKYPGMCLARPEIFKQPHRSILRPEEKLFPGQKFYLVPMTTVKKLKRRSSQKLQILGDETEGAKLEGLNGNTRAERGEGEDSDISVSSSRYDSDSDLDLDFSDVSASSAKDFYLSREAWTRCQLKCKSGEKKGDKGFKPPIKMTRMWRKIGWQPRLASVEELSP